MPGLTAVHARHLASFSQVSRQRSATPSPAMLFFAGRDRESAREREILLTRPDLLRIGAFRNADDGARGRRGDSLGDRLVGASCRSAACGGRGVDEAGAARNHGGTGDGDRPGKARTSRRIGGGRRRAWRRRGCGRGRGRRDRPRGGSARHGGIGRAARREGLRCGGGQIREREPAEDRRCDSYPAHARLRGARGWPAASAGRRGPDT